MAVQHLWGTRTSEYAKVGVVVITTQYGRTTFKVLATVLNCFLQSSKIMPQTLLFLCQNAWGGSALAGELSGLGGGGGGGGGGKLTLPPPIDELIFMNPVN